MSAHSALTLGQLTQANSARAPLDLSHIADLRRRRNVEAICRLGPRVVGELLDEIGRQRSIGTLIDQLAERFAQIDPAAVAALGGNHFPAALTVIVGGKGVAR